MAIPVMDGVIEPSVAPLTVKSSSKSKTKYAPSLQFPELILVSGVRVNVYVVDTVVSSEPSETEFIGNNPIVVTLKISSTAPSVAVAVTVMLAEPYFSA
jgi:hypothetical protein